MVIIPCRNDDEDTTTNENHRDERFYAPAWASIYASFAQCFGLYTSIITPVFPSTNKHTQTKDGLPHSTPLLCYQVLLLYSAQLIMPITLNVCVYVDVFHP